MNRRVLVTASLGLFFGSLLCGCAHVHRRPAVVSGPVVNGFAPAPGYVMPAPVPPASQALPPASQPGPAAAPPDVRLYPPDWRAIPGDGRDTAAPPFADRPGVRLLPPTTGPAPADAGQARAPTPALPVGIPEFATARERVSSGLKPHLDGLDWLQANGYRAVLHLRAPGQDDAADRREVEKRGLKYLSLEVGPESLTRAILDEYNRLVADATLQPLFVYDRDGRLAGAMWYLHFRTADKLGDEMARARAARLGLRDDADPERRTLWVAVQKLLSELGNGR